MLQDAKTIRFYQGLTDDLVELWERGYRFDELQLYLDGYLSALRRTNSIEPFQVNRLEEEVSRYIRDPSNFVSTQAQVDYY